MTQVRLENCSQLLSAQYDELGRYILQRNSFLVLSESYANTEYFLTSFFDSYPFRIKYLKAEKDKFVFIKVEEIASSFDDLDKGILDKAFELLNIRFESINYFSDYCERQDLFLVILVNPNDQNQLRYLISYSYFFKNRLTFIFANSLADSFVEKKFYLHFSDAFINSYLVQALATIGFENLMEQIELDKINSDISRIPQVIEEIISQKKSEGKVEISNNDYIEESMPVVQISSSETYIEPQIVAQIGSQEKKSIKKEGQSEVTTSNSFNLTPRESDIYDTLLQKKFISREELAEIAWGEDGKNAKADAIDQLISRMRRKLVKSGYSKDYLYSKKGEGVGITIN